jgi:putative Holliday junction resolvase
MADQPLGRVAAIDYGTVRIGIALSDSRRTIASPYENYTRRDKATDAARFQLLAKEEQVAQFVVGLPVHSSGHESQKSIEAQTFGKWLTEITGVPVAYFDERFTTVEAEQLLAQAKLTKARRKERLDMLAAQILLTAYLESTSRDAPPGALDD